VISYLRVLQPGRVHKRARVSNKDRIRFRSNSPLT